MLTLSLRCLVPVLQWKSSWAVVEKLLGCIGNGSLSKDWNPGSIMGNDVRDREKCKNKVLLQSNCVDINMHDRNICSQFAHYLHECMHHFVPPFVNPSEILQPLSLSLLCKPVFYFSLQRKMVLYFSNLLNLLPQQDFTKIFLHFKSFK